MSNWIKRQFKDWFTVTDKKRIVQLYDRFVVNRTWVPGVSCTATTYCPDRSVVPNPETVTQLRFHWSHLPLLEGLTGYTKPEPDYRQTARFESLQDIMRDYQRESARLAMSLSGSILADDLGLGKTLTSLAASHGRTLIVCPLTAVPVWQSQIEQWRPEYRSNRVELLLSSTVKDQKALKNADFIIMPYSALNKHAGGFHSSGTLGSVDTLIADEAHTMCLKSTHWAKIFAVIGTEKCILLTGTPMRNKLKSLWGLLDITAHGAWGYLSEFRQAYCGAVNGIYGIEDGEPTRIAELAKRVESVFIKHTRADAGIDIPTMDRAIVPLAPTPDDIKQLAKKTTSLSVTAKGHGDVLKVLTTLRHEVGVLKLKYLDLQKLKGIHDQYGQVVYWCWHKDIAKELEYRLVQLNMPVDLLMGETLSKQRDIIVARWGTPYSLECALVATLGAGATAISLPRAKAAVFVELDWGAYVIMQAEKRHHRFGSCHKHVTSIYPVVQGTVDEQMCRHILQKAEQSEAALGEDGQLDMAAELLKAHEGAGKKPFQDLLSRLDDDDNEDAINDDDDDWPVFVDESEW